jgi:CBS domain-containing protein
MKMAEVGVGALPVCGEDNRLKGMITDRDVVVRVLAAGKDARAVHAGAMVDGAPIITIGADEHVAYVLRTMAQHKVRRLPVIEDHQLVGIVSLADVARVLDDPEIGLVVAAISE